MKHNLLLLLALLLAWGSLHADVLTSPNGLVSVAVEGSQMHIASRQPAGQQRVMTISQLGIAAQSDAPSWRFEGVTAQHAVDDDYTMVAGKRLHATNHGREYTLRYVAADGRGARVMLRVYDDGVAFCYEHDGYQHEPAGRELTTYSLPEGSTRWMMPYTNGYEGFFMRSDTLPARYDKGEWCYPMLFEAAPGAWALISEAGIEAHHSASWLKGKADAQALRVSPDRNEIPVDGTWRSPWRVVVVGSLATVVESTLVTDVSPACRLADTSWIKPGVVSWVYWAYNHGSNDYHIIKKYVDFAAETGLPYVLIDAEWDEMKDGYRVEDAIRYAHERGVKPMIWYNSTTGWIDGAPGPKYRLNEPAFLEREFAWLEKLGVAGIKIDFFDGDNQPTMAYCIRLMEAAARHHLLINFHGATLPRGWQRTYPHLLSTEGVYGAEWYNNKPVLTPVAAAHNATLPFTRNVVGPMDYTPCAFSDSQHPHITTDAHELALTALFESGLQHLADKPESFMAQPADVTAFLGTLPTAWDETRLLGGYPGDQVVMARRSGNKWYVAGINGRNEAATIAVDLSKLAPGALRARAKAFVDGQTVVRDGRKMVAMSIFTTTARKLKRVKCEPRGGFVVVVDMASAAK